MLLFLCVGLSACSHETFSTNNAAKTHVARVELDKRARKHYALRHAPTSSPAQEPSRDLSAVELARGNEPKHFGSGLWSGRNHVIYLPGGPVAAPLFPAPSTSPLLGPSTPDDIKALQSVVFATNRNIRDGPKLELAAITDARSPQLRYGLAIVSVPKAHTIGHVERPTPYFFGLYTPKETDADDFRIQKLSSLSREQFVASLN